MSKLLDDLNFIIEHEHERLKADLYFYQHSNPQKMFLGKDKKKPKSWWKKMLTFTHK